MADPSKLSALGAIAAELAGEGTSVALTGAGAGNPGGEEAGDLFLALDDEVDAFAGATIAPPKRGPGRPKGSPNRTTLQLQRFLTARGYRDPAEFLAAIVSMDARDLAAALKGDGGSPVTFDQALEALKLQRSAAAELLPYFHKRQPQAIEMPASEARPLIVIRDSQVGLVTGGGGERGLSIDDALTDQGVTVGPALPSHD